MCELAEMRLALFPANSAALLLATCVAATGVAPGPTQAWAQTVASQPDLPLFDREKGHTIIANRVDVEVAGGPPARVTFDTGSTGLRVLESYVGPNIRRTDQPLRELYGDGTQFEGYLGFAEVAFRTRDGAALRTSADVPIHVVTKVSCIAEKPRCPGPSSLTAGIMGVRFDERKGGMLSPLRFLPGALGDGFIVDVKRDEPLVHIGLEPDRLRGFRFASLKPAQPSTTQDGRMALWTMDSIHPCFSIAGGASGCGPVIFDTGGSAMDIAAVDGLPPDMLNGDLLRAGVDVTMEVPEAFRLTVKSEGHDDVHVRPGHGGNSGERFFRFYLVAFDGKSGRLGFQPRPLEDIKAWYGR